MIFDIQANLGDIQTYLSDIQANLGDIQTNLCTFGITGVQTSLHSN